MHTLFNYFFLKVPEEKFPRCHFFYLFVLYITYVHYIFIYSYIKKKNNPHNNKRPLVIPNYNQDSVDRMGQRASPPPISERGRCRESPLTQAGSNPGPCAHQPNPEPKSLCDQVFLRRWNRRRIKSDLQKEISNFVNKQTQTCIKVNFVYKKLCIF